VAACRHGHIPLIENGDHRVRCSRGGIAELLHLKGIGKSYGGVHALRPSDLILWSGELFCLVGETGSGKTTLAMIAAGVLEPDQGERTFGGQDMDAWIKKEYKTLASRIGVIYQHPTEAVSHRLNVFEAVAEPLRIQNNGFSRQKVHDRVLTALADVRLSTRSEFLKRYPHELNMGALQRLCLARALVHDPLLLVADEPTSALDPSVQAKVLKLLLGLQIEKGLSMLFVTHDIGLARKNGDRIGVMLGGRIVEMGPAERIFNRPGHPYTAMLIDSARAARAPCFEILPTSRSAAKGCPFVHRCGRVSTTCHAAALPVVNLDGGRHLTWCHRPLQVQETLAQREAGLTST
jgi:peptide/nickel transport system ATP-binding protein